MELRRGDDLGQLFHIDWLNVDNVEALIADVEIPEIYPKVVRADVCLPIGIDADAVNMVCMRIGVDLSRDSGDNGIVMCQCWQSKIPPAADQWLRGG